MDEYGVVGAGGIELKMQGFGRTDEVIRTADGEIQFGGRQLAGEVNILILELIQVDFDWHKTPSFCVIRRAFKN